MKLCFPDLFFSNGSIIYLDNPVDAWWAKGYVKKIYTCKKLKEEKLGHGLQLSQKENHHLICTNKKWIFKMI